MIKVTNEVKVYEVDGKDPAGGGDPIVVVRSHWNRSELVVLEVCGVRLTVSAVDLSAAIVNSTNTQRFG